MEKSTIDDMDPMLQFKRPFNPMDKPFWPTLEATQLCGKIHDPENGCRSCAQLKGSLKRAMEELEEARRNRTQNK